MKTIGAGLAGLAWVGSSKADKKETKQWNMILYGVPIKSKIYREGLIAIGGNDKGQMSAIYFNKRAAEFCASVNYGSVTRTITNETGYIQKRSYPVTLNQ